MSVTRVNELFSKPLEVENLKQILHSLRHQICQCEGCREFRVLECETDPSRFVIIETWDCVESHQAAVARVSQQDVARAMGMLECRPDGDYYVDLNGR